MTRKRINLDRLPSNNKMTPNKDVNPIVRSGNVSQGRKTGLANDVRNIGNSLFESIILPAIKSAIVDFFSSGVNMVMFGQGGQDHRRRSHTSYNTQYRSRTRSTGSRRQRTRYAKEPQEVFEDIFFDNRADAELVLGRMMELIADYNVATMGDLYSLVGLATNYTYERYGWDDLRGVRVQYTTDGHVIDFPQPLYLN